MLSKNNKILIGCLALLLVMSVGYALFSDTITINGTATAKGDFDITATCQPGITNALSSTAQALGIPAEGGYENDSCSVVDDNISLNVGLKYPGARRYFTVKFTNEGSMDAALAVNDISKTGQMCTTSSNHSFPQNCNTISYNHEDSFGVGDYTLVNLYINTSDGKTSIVGGFEDENGEFVSMSSERLSEFFDMSTGEFMLKPNQSAYLLVSSRVHENVGSGSGTSGSYEYVNGEFEHSYDFTMTFPWNQKTSQ